MTSENDARLAEVLAHLVEVQSVDTAVVALVPSSLVASQAERRGTDHVAQLAVWVGRLAAAGHHVVVMPHATREGCAASRNNDLVVITRLHKLLAQDPCADDVSYVDFDVNAASIRRLVRRCDIMIDLPVPRHGCRSGRGRHPGHGRVEPQVPRGPGTVRL